MMWNKFFFITCWLCCSVLCFGQSKDAGMWMGAGFSTEVNKRLELSIAPELRLEENMLQVASVFADFGGSYKLSKALSLSLTYRLGGRNNGEFYALRQRFQYGISAKFKYEDWSLTAASRWQSAISMQGSESDIDFVNTYRNRIKLTYSGLKKVDLTSGFEVFHSVSLYQSPVWSNWRWTGSVEYSLNKRNAISCGYLIQKDRTKSPQEMDFVILLGYDCKLKLFKKKKDDLPNE